MKLSQVESELSDVTSDYERLGLFFSEYKEKSMEKVREPWLWQMCVSLCMLCCLDGHTEGECEEGG